MYKTSLNYSRKIPGINSSKGISPIIATILLLAITISVATLFPSWILDLTDTVTQETSQQSQNILEGASTSLEIVEATYLAPSNKARVLVKLGSQNDINSSFNAVAYCEGSFGGAGSFKEINGLESFEFNTTCEPDRIKVSLINYPSTTDTSQIEITGYTTWTVNNLQTIVDASNNISYQPLTLERNQQSIGESVFDGQKINTTVDNGEIRLEN